MAFKETFISIYNKTIHREGSTDLLKYLLSDESDFFTAPASSRYHGSHSEGLVSHSLNVYECLNDYLSRDTVRNLYDLSISPESTAIAALQHDVCKINIYRTSTRNVKDSTGNWQKVPYYEFDDRFPYGHGEKSVYIISKYMKLTDEEAFAIRYHMGFSGTDEARNVGDAFRLYPLALALSIADMEATFFLEK